MSEANEVRQRRPGTAADQPIPKHPVEISFPELDAKDATPIDIVITIPARKCTSQGYSLLEWLVDEFAASLTAPQKISISYSYHTKTESHALYLSATDEALLRGAEEQRIRKKIKPAHLANISKLANDECVSPSRQGSGDQDSSSCSGSGSASSGRTTPADSPSRGQGQSKSKGAVFAYREFSRADAALFVNFEKGARAFLSTFECQNIVLTMLYELHFNTPSIERLERCQFANCKQLASSLDSAHLVMQTLIDKELISVYGMHEERELHHLRKHWANPMLMFKPQPLDQVKHYFGPTICIYFAWLGT